MRAIKFIAKFILWFLAGIIALVAIVLIVLQTSFVKERIVRIAENQVNNLLNAELSIGKLEGNFFNGLQLSDVMLRSMEKDTIAFIPHLQLSYQLLPLLNNRILVEDLTIDDPYIYLAQLPDSTWNVQQIIIPSEDTDTIPFVFNWDVLVNNLNLNNGFVRIFAYNEQIPHAVHNLNLDASGFYSTAEQEIDLKELKLYTTEPNIILSTLNLQAKARNLEEFELENLLIRTAQNELTGQGNFNLSGEGRSAVEINTQPFNLDEFRAFLPENFTLNAKPILNLNASLESKNLDLSVLIHDNSQQIDLKVLAYQLLEFLSDSTVAPITYDLVLNMDKIDLKYWLGDPQLNYQINGNVTGKGEGLDPETMRVNLKGDFGNLVLYNNPIDRLNLELNYLAGNVDGIVDGRGSFGSVHLVPKLQQVLSDNPLYQVELNTRNLDVSPFLGNSEYKTDLNLDANVSGSGFEIDRINAASTILMDTSYAMGIRVDTLNSQIDFIRQNLIINNFFLETMSVFLEAEGNYNLRGSSDLNLEARVDNINEIKQFAGLEQDIQTSANLRANLQGQPDDLQANILLNVGNTRFEEILIDTMYAVVDGTIRNNFSEIEAVADIHVNRFVSGSINVDDIHLQVETDTRNYLLNFTAEGADIQAQLNSMIQLGDAINVVLSDLSLAYKGYAWHQVSDTAFVHIGDTEYEVRNFHLASDSAELPQTIYADGVVRRLGEQDLRLNVANLDVGRILEILDINQNIQGLANLNVLLEGDAITPSLTGALNMDSTILQDYRFDTIRANINLLNNEFKANLNVIPEVTGAITGEGRIPMEIRLDSMQFNVMPDENAPVYLNLLIDRLPLNILQVFMPADEIDGTIESRINVDGTFGNPEIVGNLNIQDGLLKIDQYGINYHNIQTAVDIQNDAVNVDTFLIQSNDGNMTANGNVQFASELYNADLSSSELSILFDRFNPFDHRQFNMELSGNVDLTAAADSVLFSGNLTIPEANIYLPAILNIIGRVSTPNIPKPLLVVELERMDQQGDSVIYNVRPAENEADSASASRFNFMNNLQGSLRVEIPRNTWIRNDDMRIELSGDVELLKHRDFFELFGTIDVVRGQYNLLGKVFVIETGTVTFQGGEQLNPILNVEANYSFRDPDRNRRDLTVAVTGELEDLEIKFTLEGQDVSEGDALSYILFGVNLDALASGQRSSIDAAGIAETAAASLISSQLTRLLGNTLSVDYIEFTAGSSFDNASFTVGKYITNRLFVSYEQHIGAIEDRDIARYEVTVEYEIFRFLFLQLASSPITTGFDLIFKVNSDTGFNFNK